MAYNKNSAEARYTRLYHMDTISCLSQSDNSFKIHADEKKLLEIIYDAKGYNLLTDFEITKVILTHFNSLYPDEIEKMLSYVDGLAGLHKTLGKYGQTKEQINDLVTADFDILEESKVKGLKLFTKISAAREVDLNDTLSNLKQNPTILANRKIANANLALLSQLGLDKEALANDLSVLYKVPAATYGMVEMLKMEPVRSLDLLKDISENLSSSKIQELYPIDSRELVQLTNEYNAKINEKLQKQNNDYAMQRR